MAKPTDGPWIMQLTRQGVEVTGAGGRLVHFEDIGAVPTELPQYRQEQLWEETVANARLIAKARHLPALVEALKTLMDLHLDYVGGTATGLSKEHSEKLAPIFAALALVQDEDHG